MKFLPDVYAVCDDCQGLRYNRETLRAEFKDLSIGQVLNLEVDQAIEFFDGFETIRKRLEVFQQVGLGYLTLGQPSNTLSGGEAQRLKLATELSSASSSHTLYLLDEPTTGLHFGEVAKLISVLRALVGLGHSVIVVEHQLDLIMQSDWIIDLGPDGGHAGGEIVAKGTPSQVMESGDSETGKALKRWLEQRGVS